MYVIIFHNIFIVKRNSISFLFILPFLLWTILLKINFRNCMISFIAVSLLFKWIDDNVCVYFLAKPNIKMIKSQKEFSFLRHRRIYVYREMQRFTLRNELHLYYSYNTMTQIFLHENNLLCLWVGFDGWCILWKMNFMGIHSYSLQTVLILNIIWTAIIF